MPARADVPEPVKSEVLAANDHTCCICRTVGSDVQIHHIDGHPSNNDFSNLAVLCLNCHSKVTGPRGLGRSYTKEEVREYKRRWEMVVKSKGLLPLPVKKISSSVESRLIEFAVREHVYELAYEEDPRVVDKVLGYLELLGWAESKTSYVLDQIKVMSPMLSVGRKGVLVVSSLRGLFRHLVGPLDWVSKDSAGHFRTEGVRVGPDDELNLKVAVEIADSFARWENAYGDDMVTRAALEALFFFYKVGRDFHFVEEKKAAVKAIRRISHEGSGVTVRHTANRLLGEISYTINE